jgi:hypothetical protein
MRYAIPFTYVMNNMECIYFLNFVFENLRKILLSSFNIQLDLAVLVTTLHTHARYTDFYTHTGDFSYPQLYNCC